MLHILNKDVSLGLSPTHTDESRMLKTAKPIGGEGGWAEAPMISLVLIYLGHEGDTSPSSYSDNPL